MSGDGAENVVCAGFEVHGHLFCRAGRNGLQVNAGPLDDEVMLDRAFIFDEQLHFAWLHRRTRELDGPFLLRDRHGGPLRRPARLTTTLLPTTAARRGEGGHEHDDDSQPDPSAHCHPPLTDDEVENLSKNSKADVWWLGSRSRAVEQSRSRERELLAGTRRRDRATPRPRTTPRQSTRTRQ